MENISLESLVNNKNILEISVKSISYINNFIVGFKDKLGSGLTIGRKSNMAPPGSGGASNASHHLDAVPSSTPIHIVAKNKKKIRSYPFFLNSCIDKSVTDNANQEEVLVPIRLDMELEG